MISYYAVFLIFAVAYWIGKLHGEISEAKKHINELKSLIEENNKKNHSIIRIYDRMPDDSQYPITKET